MWIPSGGPYICWLFLRAELGGERVSLRVVDPVSGLAGVIDIVDQTDLRPDQLQEAIFATLVQTLDGPEVVINSLKADDLVWLSRPDFDRAVRINAPFGSKVPA